MDVIGAATMPSREVIQDNTSENKFKLRPCLAYLTPRITWYYF